MGQYYIPYVKHQDTDANIFNNIIDDDYNGLKLMEHSWWLNGVVGNVVNDLFYNKGQVCWVGDYYAEDDYSQVNCGKAKVKAIGKKVWGGEGDNTNTKCLKSKVRFLDHCLIVNHTKKEILDCDTYYSRNVYFEKWEGVEYPTCVHPLPLLTCSASHSGGSYYGINQDKCGIWFNDTIEVVLRWETDNLIDQGYKQVMFEFNENI